MEAATRIHGLEHMGLPEKLAPRHTLLNVFHRAAAKRLGYVHAPAGSGKTVSTLLWLNDSGRKGVWITLGGEQNALPDFLQKIGKALLSLQPYNREAARILDRSGLGSLSVEYMQRLAASMIEDEDLYALIIDDFHCIENEEIHKCLSGLLTALPYGFSSFVLSRNNAPETMEELLNMRRSSNISKDELSFTPVEIGAYFSDHGRNLNEAEVNAIHAMTKGWPMGVQVLALAGSVNLGFNESRLIEDYLHDHAWERWPEDIRVFLAQCSIVDDMTPELCTRLTGREDSEAILGELCAANMFIADSGRGGYRCHHLFRDFLRGKLEGRREDDKQRLYMVAAEFYRETGRYYDALRFSAHSGDYAGVEACMLELYKYSTTGNAVAEHAAKLKSCMLDLIPDAVLKEKPYLLINYVWYHYLIGEAEPMLRYIERVSENFETIMAKHNAFSELAICITSLDFRKSVAGIVQKKQNACNATYRDKKQMQAVVMTVNMPFFHRSNRDYSSFALEPDTEPGAFRQVFSGILKPDILNICLAELQGGVLYEQDRLEEAALYADNAIDSLLPDTVAELKMGAMLLRAVICLARGEQDEYEDRLGDIKAMLDRENAMYLMPNLLAVETKHRLMNADKGVAREWLTRYFVSESDQPELYKIFQHFTTARAYIALNRVTEALSLLEKLKALSASFNRTLDMAEAGILLALVLWGMGERQKARAIMDETLELTQQYGFVRIIADEGASILPVLRDCLNDLNGKASLGRLDREYVNNVYLAACAVSKKHRGLGWNIHVKPVKLSRQQIKILSLIARGFKQKQIAEMTSLTLPTVKSHTYVMYKKLDVTNAANAILKARGIGLLE
ncbi:LuxR C-terminal-related transcriptional regulator [Desulfovibrio sp. OttesenSCG-928-C14]|nr:LuxR C-terminal-related transcriptional regulator [Desulfovibrio sp. OttesenSCG-928-C14]